MDYMFYEEKAILGKDLVALFTALNWESARFGDRLGTVAEKTISLGAWESGMLVGYLNSFSDGLNAYLQYFCVHPGYQRRGIGSALMARMIQRLEDHERIALTAVEEAREFYRKAGFFPRTGKLSLAYKDM